MQPYLEHAKRILTSPASGYKPNRTGIDTISLFGHQNEYDLSKGLPLLTTKSMAIKSAQHELIWFLRGDTNIKYLVDNKVHIWDGNAFQHHLKKTGQDKKFPMYSPEWHKEKENYIERIKSDNEFAREHGNLDDVYGAQWRRWKTPDGREIDQIADVVDQLKNKPQSRRMIVTAWNPAEIAQMALPPCHTLFHLNVLEGKLDCQLYQRSADMFLGVPFNIVSYSMLTTILAQQADLQPGRFVHTFGDSHFYCGGDNRGKFYGAALNLLKGKVDAVQTPQEYLQLKEWIERTAPPETKGKEGQDHVTGILEQLSREPKPLPKIKIANKPFDKLTIDDFVLEDYNPHPAIKRAMAV